MTATAAPTTGLWVGTHEACEILEVEPGRIARYIAKDRLPTPWRLRCSPVWLRAELEQFAATDERVEVDRSGPPPVLGTHEAAELLGVNKRQISRWRETPLKSLPFPEPDHRIKAGPLWNYETISEFASARQRR